MSTIAYCYIMTYDFDCLVVFFFFFFFFFFQAEDGIRDVAVTGVDVCSSDLGGPRADAADERQRDEESEQREARHRLEHVRSEERRVGKECRSEWERDE